MMAKRKNNAGNEILAGVVTPVQWLNDQVTAVALCATDDEVYWIENGDKFLDLVQQNIEASGQVTRGRKAHRYIRIKRYKVIEEY